MARPKDSDSAKIQERILSAAIDSLESVGPSAITMRQIAKAAGLSLGTVHYYFPNKDALLEAVFDQLLANAYALRDELVRALLGTAGTPAALLESAVRVAYRTTLRMRAASRLMQIMALDQGFIPHRRRAEEELVLGALSELAARTDIAAPVQARLLIKTLLFCTGRYATLNMDELRRVTGLPSSVTDDAVHAAVENHLVDLARVFTASR